MRPPVRSKFFDGKDTLFSGVRSIGDSSRVFTLGGWMYDRAAPLHEPTGEGDHLPVGLRLHGHENPENSLVNGGPPDTPLASVMRTAIDLRSRMGQGYFKTVVCSESHPASWSDSSWREVGMFRIAPPVR